MSPHIPVSGLLLRAREAMRVAVQEQEPSWPELGPGGVGARHSTATEQCRQGVKNRPEHQQLLSWGGTGSQQGTSQLRPTLQLICSTFSWH